MIATDKTAGILNAMINQLIRNSKFRCSSSEGKAVQRDMAELCNVFAMKCSNIQDPTEECRIG